MRDHLKHLSRLCAAVLLWCLALPPAAASADFRAELQTGVAAYQAGDYTTALAKFAKLAEAGDPNAQFNLAVLYLSGRGVERDVAKAIDLHRKAASQGLPSAEHGLGVLYYQGVGVDQDFAEALKWFRRAAAKGFAESEFNLGVMYFNRQGVKRDDIEVVKWVTLAAARKFAPAQYRMGQMYEKGVIFAEDTQAALYWYRQAETNGSKKAAATRARLAQALDIDAPSPGSKRPPAPKNATAKGEAIRKAAPAPTPLKASTAATPPAPPARPVAKAPSVVTTPQAPASAPEPAASKTAVPATQPARTVPPAPEPAAQKPSPSPRPQSDGWKNPFSLTPPPETLPSPVKPVQTRNLPGSAAASPETVREPSKAPGSAAATPGSAPAASPAGEWRAQFAAYRSAEDAASALAVLNRRAGAAIGRTPRMVDLADLGDRGIFYRLQAGPLDGPEEVAKLCKLVKAVLPRQDCVPVRIGNR